jgi:hypothetical protein
LFEGREGAGEASYAREARHAQILGQSNGRNFVLSEEVAIAMEQQQQSLGKPFPSRSAWGEDPQADRAAPRVHVKESVWERLFFPWRGESAAAFFIGFFLK